MKRRVLVFWAALLVLLFPIVASASEWWKDEALKGKLKLSEEQVKKIDSIVEAATKNRTETLKTIRSKMKALNELLSKENLDRKKAEKMLDEIAKLRTGLLKADLSMKLNARDVLTKEQIKTLLKERPRVFTLRSRWSKTRPFKLPAVRSEDSKKRRKAL